MKRYANIKDYKAEITEYLQRLVDVIAEFSVKAVEKIEEEYDNSEIVLWAKDFVRKEIENKMCCQ